MWMFDRDNREELGIVFYRGRQGSGFRGKKVHLERLNHELSSWFFPLLPPYSSNRIDVQHTVNSVLYLAVP
jgi:hypothetical protein